MPNALIGNRVAAAFARCFCQARQPLAAWDAENRTRMTVPCDLALAPTTLPLLSLLSVPVFSPRFSLLLLFLVPCCFHASLSHCLSLARRTDDRIDRMQVPPTGHGCIDNRVAMRPTQDSRQEGSKCLSQRDVSPTGIAVGCCGVLWDLFNVCPREIYVLEDEPRTVGASDLRERRSEGTQISFTIHSLSQFNSSFPTVEG